MSESKYTVHPNYPEVKIWAKEEWKNIPGFGGLYQASNKGRIRSIPRIIIRDVKNRRRGDWVTRTIAGRILKPANDRGTRLFVGMCGGTHSVHRLVLSSFIPQPAGKKECCHNDGDPTNNRLENLRWDTHKGNHQDRVKHGTNNAGETNGSSVLTEKEVVLIRQMYASNKYLMKNLAKMFGVKEDAIRKIVRGITWKHISYLPNSNFGRGANRTRKLKT